MKRVALFVGVDRYEDKAFRDLRYSVADAGALSGAFARYGFETYVATNPGNRALLEEVERRTAGLGAGDVFVFFFAGHGYTGPGGEHLLICRDDRLQWLRHNRAGVPVDMLEELTNGKGFHRAFLLDACRTDVFSGMEGRGGAETRDLGLVAMPDAEKYPGTCCVVRSCDRFCPALEFENLGHGVFTQAVLDFLDGPEGRTVQMGEAFMDGVRERMRIIQRREGSPVQQTPTFQSNGAAFALFGRTAGTGMVSDGAGVTGMSGTVWVECEVCHRNMEAERTYACPGCGKRHVCEGCRDGATALCADCAEEEKRKRAAAGREDVFLRKVKVGKALAKWKQEVLCGGEPEVLERAEEAWSAAEEALKAGKQADVERWLGVCEEALARLEEQVDARQKHRRQTEEREVALRTTASQWDEKKLSKEEQVLLEAAGTRLGAAHTASKRWDLGGAESSLAEAEGDLQKLAAMAMVRLEQRARELRQKLDEHVFALQGEEITPAGRDALERIRQWLAALEGKLATKHPEEAEQCADAVADAIRCLEDVQKAASELKETRDALAKCAKDGLATLSKREDAWELTSALSHERNRRLDCLWVRALMVVGVPSKMFWPDKRKAEEDAVRNAWWGYGRDYERCVERMVAKRERIRTLATQCGMQTPPPFPAPAPLPEVKTKTLELPGGAQMEMVWCPPGDFLMGSTKGEEGESEGRENEHPNLTSLPWGFWIAKHPVTQKQWKSVMGGNPSHFKGDDRPVENVSWHDCADFCKKAGYGLTLPAEAEWEYACRAGCPVAYGGTGWLEDMGWWGGNSGMQTHPVGAKRPNAWGLYDMHGNVWEWCADWYARVAHGIVDRRDLSSARPNEHRTRVLRGGAWKFSAGSARSACRWSKAPDCKDNETGFRPVIPEGWQERERRLEAEMAWCRRKRIATWGLVALLLACILWWSWNSVAGAGTEGEGAVVQKVVQWGVAGEGGAGKKSSLLGGWRSWRERRAAKAAFGALRAGTKAGDEKAIPLGEGVEMKMVWCPAGSFWMGSPEWEKGRRKDEKRHHVTLSKGFWLAKHEVTQRQWETVMGSRPESKHTGDDLPVEGVDWTECQEFCRKLGLALPTEAQWEYACRAGRDGEYGGSGWLWGMGWYKENSQGGPHPVGGKEPNDWGLHDMHGNVREWCADWYGVYPDEPEVTDPQRVRPGWSRVFRGGEWADEAVCCRSAYRNGGPHGKGYGGSGFRPAKNLP